VDVLWLLPEPLVVSRNNLQSLFLQTYRQRCPVLAYSSRLVEAGALLGLYATPEQLGREAGQWLKSLLPAESRKPPPPRYPVSFSVAVNPSVARSLNLNVPPADELTRRLRALHIP
jgi:putative ABC transport system substrate-binding protein